ncbi:RNA degradosome polyphosphate kinase [Clostridiales bacterium COT073_COT-073]|nr:RNA degradosome polyphosphate kinase [Clostridiales bacterium COT073_COT-073]
MTKKEKKYIDLLSPEYYENRELSWLEFNQRVLEEAENPENPLFERLKFLSIVSSNLDEFFMVRVASLKEQVNAGYLKEDFAGFTPKGQLKAISLRTHVMVEEQVQHFKRGILPQLRKKKIFLHSKLDKLTDTQKRFLEQYFADVLYPTLTPMGVDSSRPFPLIMNKTLNIGVIVENKGKEEFATIQVPAIVDRLVKIPAAKEGNHEFVYLEDIIIEYIEQLFVGRPVLACGEYRITRNSDLSIDEEEAEDLLLEIEKSIQKRKWGQAIRLELKKGLDERIVNHLQKSLEVHTKDVYEIDGPLDFTFLMKFYGDECGDAMKFPAFTPCQPWNLLGKEDLFTEIRERDIFLHHPFESFQPVVDFVKAAAEDPNVLAIKQTLYRVSGRSPIIQALAKAAQAGKQVTVLVELKARFDEENNIQWARSLERAGCHVIYGLVGLKTHSKITLVVRKEEDGIRRYVHLGTGNYNDVTARFYTDMGLLTCNELIGADASAVFNTLSGYSEPPRLHKLTMAPTGLRDKFYSLIRREAEHAAQGRPAKMICKMNSLCDFGIMKEIYKAAMAGVKIELIVRGICGVIPGIPEVSENITVRSIVGKYLEHSRVYYFYNDGREEVYLSSADFMPRNLDRRVELLFPIEDEKIKQRLIFILGLVLRDTVKAKIKNTDKQYQVIDRRGKEVLNSQSRFEELAMERADHFEKHNHSDIFIPVIGQEEEQS